METTKKKIQDFGEKIGGAKKDLARQYIDRLSLITNDALITQPLSKSFPRPDFAKMFRENLITEENTIKLSYLYDSIETKPRRTYAVQRWVTNTMVKILLIKDILDEKPLSEDIKVFESTGFQIHAGVMKAGGWPAIDFNLYPYQIIKDFMGFGFQVCVVKGQRIKKRGTIEECVEWIKENSGTKTATKPQYDIFRYRSTEEVFITPKGKKEIILVRGLQSVAEAKTYIAEKSDELEEKYKIIRTIPEERRDWNRPRVGENHRNGKDVSPELFKTDFPFRGVEFGNWVNQVERAACLNEAYDALSDLSAVLGINNDIITLNGKLALAFGARGSGTALAHYEPIKVVINLTKKKGAGSLAHEWFHALDNYISITHGSPLSFASDNPRNISDERLSDTFRNLVRAINASDFYTRSARIDKLKTKKYWATTIELAARGFEKYVISKLAILEFENDYLANIRTMEEFGRPDVYPYPTNEEIKLLIPLYDEVISSVYNTMKLRQSA